MRNYCHSFIGGPERQRKKIRMTKIEIEKKMASQEQRITALELALDKIQTLLTDVLTRWPQIQEIMSQLTSSRPRPERW